MSFLEDIKSHVESNTSLNAYPLSIPQDTPYPVIEFSPIGFDRNSSSNMEESNVSDRRIQFTVVSESSSECLFIGEDLVTLYEGLSGLVGSTKILIARVQNTVPLYNQQQQTYEYAVDVMFTINK